MSRSPTALHIPYITVPLCSSPFVPHPIQHTAEECYNVVTFYLQVLDPARDLRGRAEQDAAGPPRRHRRVRLLLPPALPSPALQEASARVRRHAAGLPRGVLHPGALGRGRRGTVPHTLDTGRGCVLAAAPNARGGPAGGPCSASRGGSNGRRERSTWTALWSGALELNLLWASDLPCRDEKSGEQRQAQVADVIVGGWLVRERSDSGDAQKGI